jgi:hypothetical protein
VEQVLLHRGGLAHRALAELRETLASVLQELGKTCSSAPADVGAVRDLTFRELPAPDLRPLRPLFDAVRPWWVLLLPGLAEWGTRQALAAALGPSLSDRIDAYDRRVQSWLSACLTDLVQAYEAQTERYRDRGPKLAPDGNGDGHDRAALEADIGELRRAAADPAVEPTAE